MVQQLRLNREVSEVYLQQQWPHRHQSRSNTKDHHPCHPRLDQLLGSPSSPSLLLVGLPDPMHKISRLVFSVLPPTIWKYLYLYTSVRNRFILIIIIIKLTRTANSLGLKPASLFRPPSRPPFPSTREACLRFSAASKALRRAICGGSLWETFAPRRLPSEKKPSPA